MRKAAILALICCLIANTVIFVCVADLPDRKDARLLNAYSRGHRGTDSIVSGMESVFSNSAMHIDLQYEYKHEEPRFEAAMTSDNRLESTRSSPAGLSGIDRTSLPQNSRFINMPSRYGIIRKSAFWDVAASALFFLMCVNTALLINITVRKRAASGGNIPAYNAVEEAICKKEEILRATFNATMDGILVVSSEGKMIDYNRKFMDMWDIPEEWVRKKNERVLLEYIKSQLTHPEDFIDQVGGMYSEPAAKLYQAEFIDGRVYEIHMAPLVVPGGEDGLRMGQVWSCRDITMRVITEKALSESEERYRKLVEVSPDAIFVSVGGNIIFTNAAAVKLLGLAEAGQVVGKSVADFLHEDYREILEYKIREAARGRHFMPLSEQKIIRADGSHVDVEIVVTEFYHMGKPALMCVVRDITERKRAGELKRKMEENMMLLNEALEYDKLKTEFFANISHELRTPLNIILGSLQLFNVLLTAQEGNDQRSKMVKYTGIMRQNCYRLLRLLNNLIDITRIDSGFFTVHLKNQDIVNIVEDITLSVAEYVENKGIRLVFDTNVEEKRIACDPDKIERIMLNLLSNAIKFTNLGDTISVELQDNGSFIAIRVKDTGIGIPQDKLDVVFERFRQVDKSFTRSCEGSGIGLSLVKSLVELHGGKIEAKSEVGVGSEFIVKLPARLLSKAEEDNISETAVQSRIERINIEFSDIYI